MQLYKGDCLEVMKQIPDKSVDMILCDLPYGTTACSWDIIIPFDKLWEQYNRIIKDNGAIVLFGSEPFSSALRMSNINWYRYDWVWQKQQGTNPFQSRFRPLKTHENIIVFYKKQGTFNRQMTTGKPYKGFSDKTKPVGAVYGKSLISLHKENNGTRCPKTVIQFNTERTGLHPTQKPVELCEYLIKTYTNAGETVLDNCMGSGTTGVACKHLNRNFIGIELDPNYFEIAKNRIENESTQLTLTEQKDVK